MSGQRADARKRQEAMFAEPRWSSDPDTRQTRALAALQRVYASAELAEADALLLAFEDEGFEVR